MMQQREDFTKLGRELAVAVKEGGGRIRQTTAVWRDVIARRKQTTCRMIRSTETSRKRQEKVLETTTNTSHTRDTGQNGTAIIVKTLTDNKNRTAGNVRNAFTKGNGSIGTQGCVSYMFDQKGQIIIDKEECEMDADEDYDACSGRRC